MTFILRGLDIDMKTIAAKKLFMAKCIHAGTLQCDRQTIELGHPSWGGGGHSDFFFGDVPPPPSKGLGNGPEGQKNRLGTDKRGEIGGLQNGLKNPRGSSLIANWTI